MARPHATALALGDTMSVCARRTAWTPTWRHTSRCSRRRGVCVCTARRSTGAEIAVPWADYLDSIAAILRGRMPCRRQPGLCRAERLSRLGCRRRRLVLVQGRRRRLGAACRACRAAARRHGHVAAARSPCYAGTARWVGTTGQASVARQMIAGLEASAAAKKSEQAGKKDARHRISGDGLYKGGTKGGAGSNCEVSSPQTSQLRQTSTDGACQPCINCGLAARRISEPAPCTVHYTVRVRLRRCCRTFCQTIANDWRNFWRVACYLSSESAKCVCDGAAAKILLPLPFHMKAVL